MKEVEERDTGAVAQDRFVDMVSATAEVDLRLSDFRPRTALRTAVHCIERPRFPVIDYHNHLDSMRPEDVLSIMDRCGVEHVVNKGQHSHVAQSAQDGKHLFSPRDRWCILF